MPLLPAPRLIDPAAVLAHKQETGSVVGLPDTHTITNEELLELPCDVLIPAALENQIRRDNAERVKARLARPAPLHPELELASAPEPVREAAE